MKTLARLQLTLLFFVGLTCARLEADDWPQWRGLHRDGISHETNLHKDWTRGVPQQTWKRFIGVGVSSMAVQGNLVYSMGNQKDLDTVYALRADTGRVVWNFKYACPFQKRMFEGGTAATPTVDGDRVFVASFEGHLFCLNAQTGEVIWKRHLVRDFGGRVPRWGYAGSPLVNGDTLIVETGSAEGSLIALDKVSGRLLWKAGNYPAAYSSPVLQKGVNSDSLLIFNRHGLVSFGAESGKELWSYRWETDHGINASTPIVFGNKVFLSSGYGKGATLLNLESGRPIALWKSRDFANQFSSSVLVDGYLYGFHGNVGRGVNTLRCVEFGSGQVAWTEPGLGVGAVIVVDNTLVILSEHGEMILAEPNAVEYREIARMQLLGSRNWVAPAYANGRLYCRNNQGELVCLPLSAGKNGDLAQN